MFESAGAGFAWHQDTGVAVDFPYPWQNEPGINCGIYLHDSTVANGWVYGNFDITFGPSLTAFTSSVPLYIRCVMCSTWCPGLPYADWGLRSDAASKFRNWGFRYDNFDVILDPFLPCC